MHKATSWQLAFEREGERLRRLSAPARAKAKRERFWRKVTRGAATLESALRPLPGAFTDAASAFRAFGKAMAP